MQRIFWIYVHNNFVIGNMDDFRTTEAGIKCTFVPITFDNCLRVQDFREQRRVAEYDEKLVNKEIGFFAEYNGRIVGSIWTTINRTRGRSVVRMHMPLMPNEALIHDIVTADRCRGMGVGPFMVGRISSILLNDYRVDRIIIDVSCKNRPSLRMMEKVGLKAKERVFSISLFSRLAFRKTLTTVSARAS